MYVVNAQMTDPSSTENQPLVVNVPSFLGEVVMAVPMLRLLADSGFSLRCLGREWARELLASIPGQCDSLTDRKYEAAWYRATGASWGVAARGSFRVALNMRRAGLKVVGRRGNGRGFLLTESLPRKCPGHRIEAYLQIGQAAVQTIAGGTRSAVTTDHIPRLQATPEQVTGATTLLRTVRSPFVFCTPTAGHKQASTFKLWPAFDAFMQRLVARGHEVVICPKPVELGWFKGIPPGVRVLDGVGVGDLIGVLSRSASVISNDTGTAHLAAALGRPTITLFGDTDPNWYAPRGPRALHLGSVDNWPSLEHVWSTWQRLSEGES